MVANWATAMGRWDYAILMMLPQELFSRRFGCQTERNQRFPCRSQCLKNSGIAGAIGLLC